MPPYSLSLAATLLVLLFSLILSVGIDTTSVHLTIIAAGDGDGGTGSTDTDGGDGSPTNDDGRGPAITEELDGTTSRLLLPPRLEDLDLSLEVEGFGGRVMRAEILASSGEPGWSSLAKLLDEETEKLDTLEDGLLGSLRLMTL